MSSPELTEAFLAKAAGWEVIKHARELVAQNAVLSSNWTPPILKGVVQEGSTSFRSGLVIKGPVDIENLCGCPSSRQWGTICVHSVAVGLRHIKKTSPTAESSSGPARSQSGTPANRALSTASLPPRDGKRIQRAAPGTGQSLDIHVILPPNLALAIGHGRIMFCFEGKWSGGRAPLASVPQRIPFALSEQDAQLLDKAEELAGGDSPSMLMVPAAAAAELMAKLAEHPRVTLGKSQPVRVLGSLFRPKIEATLDSSGQIHLRNGAPSKTGPAILAGEKQFWALAGNEIHAVKCPRLCLDLLIGGREEVIGRPQIPLFLSNDWAQMESSCDLTSNFKIDDFSLEPRAPQFLLSLFGGIAQLQAQLQCRYGQRILTLGASDAGETFWMPDDSSPTSYWTRDLASEHQAIGRLRMAGFVGPDAQGRWQMAGQNQVLNFFARHQPKLEREWEVTLEARLEQSTARNIERIEPRFEVAPSGEQWFDLGVSFGTASGERFSAADIQRLVLSGQGHTRLKNGKFALIDTGAVEELQQVLLDCSPQQEGGSYRIAANQSAYIDSTLRQNPDWKFQAPPDWQKRRARQRGEVHLESPDLGDLNSVLRDYQKHGVAWIQFLRTNGFGGILADEMGLGKTLQALAFLRFIASGTAARPADPANCPALVICPTSLVFNWESEAKRFTPTMRVLSLNGPRRHESFTKMDSSDLIITSYALIRRDWEHYRKIEFDTVILDEAQHIKNRQTQNSQAVKSIRARHRLVLTGTPLENSVLDLWSIFDFLMPGYLGTAADFRDRYELPISREKDPGAQQRLARRINPFLLRRMKRDVAKELPEKIEQVSFCELTEDQRAVYQQLLEAGRREVLEAGGAQGFQKNRMAVLTALLRLRQVCCDLRLLKLDGVDPSNASGKLELFQELLEEVIDGGHRVLVFSQFTSMLALIRDSLGEQGIEFCYLDGSTADRGAVVNRFQTTATIPVFLISLKAGGVGLNLAAADTVIHFDPWWNPAVEDQATDRAHRIGQTRVVTNYKLIAKGTVEEKILNLQRRKRVLTASLLGDEEAFTGQLTWEEVEDLFR